jgi:hypothetical protein
VELLFLEKMGWENSYWKDKNVFNKDLYALGNVKKKRVRVA